MKTQNKYWMIICVALSVTSAALLTVLLLYWYQLPSEAQLHVRLLFIEHWGYFFSAGLVLLLAFGFAADWIFRAYVKPINRMTEQVDLINRVNPDLRVTISGSHDVRRLGQIINQGVELWSNLQQGQAVKQISEHTEIETEKAILATFLSNLLQAILVCNLEGRIVFYNRKAKDLLLPEDNSMAGAVESDEKWLGIGRSIYHFINADLIQKALERMANLLAKDRNSASERFLLTLNHDVVMPAEIIPVLDSQHHITGYIIYIEDLAAIMEKEKEDSKHLQLWQHQLTQSISIIKTAAEILEDNPQQPTHEHQQMVQILAEQADLAARLWTKKEIADRWPEANAWPLTPMIVKDWSKHLSAQITPLLNLELNIEPESLLSKISIDIYNLTKCVVSLVSKMSAHSKMDDAQAFFYKKEAWIYVDLIWKGQGIGDEALKQWKDLPLGSPSEGPTITAQNVLLYHGARLWPYRKHDRPEYAGLRLLIPAIADSEPMDINGRVTILPDSRPEFYDFNLFQQVGHSPELNLRRLHDLTYTVFDTETTGLDPSGGDEIISIGAMRIVNGHLLREDQFNQLIDPKRHLPWASIKYHGIRPEMLIDQPSIEQVLPKFQRFVQDTVLVGHNVAFDMRMLQVKEALTGVKLINPVLDTMLLSSIVHPAHENHNLSGIAERMGISIKGRHTAIGDAAATGQIFLKLLPLLSQIGIHTIGEAIEASKKSYYARMKY